MSLSGRIQGQGSRGQGSKGQRSRGHRSRVTDPGSQIQGHRSRGQGSRGQGSRGQRSRGQRSRVTDPGVKDPGVKDPGTRIREVGPGFESGGGSGGGRRSPAPLPPLGKFCGLEPPTNIAVPREDETLCAGVRHELEVFPTEKKSRVFVSHRKEFLS